MFSRSDLLYKNKTNKLNKMFSGPYHRRNILQHLRFYTTRTDRTIWWMWATPQLNYPVPVQHSKRPDASRKHASSPILCFRSTCNSSIDEHWRIKIKSLLNPSALILSITIPQVHLLHVLCYVPMLLKHFLLAVFVSHSQSL